MDRFDLEQQIMQCWNVVEDITLLTKLEGVKKEDYQALARIYEIKFSSMFDTFSKLIEEEKIIQRLKSMDDKEPLKLPVAGSIPVRRTKAAVVFLDFFQYELLGQLANPQDRQQYRNQIQMTAGNRPAPINTF